MKHSKPKVGLWFAPCCVLDVSQLIDQSDVDNIGFCDDEHDDDEACNTNLISYGFYDTEAELLAEIKRSDPTNFDRDASDRQRALVA